MATRWLALLLIGYLGVAIAHAVVAPLHGTGYSDAPDEAAHVHYVRVLAAGRLPSRAVDGARPDGYEWHQPPLYYALAVPFALAGDRGIRALSILFGGVAVVLVFATARVVLPGRPMSAIAAAAIPATLPQFAATNSAANNDALLNLCCAAFYYMGAVLITRGPTNARAMLLGAITVAALWTKATGLALLVPACVLWGIVAYQKQCVKHAVRFAAVSAVPLLLYAPWLLHNAAVYGQPLPVDAFAAAFTGTAQAVDIAHQVGGWGSYWALMARWTSMSFVCVYGDRRGAALGIPRFLPGQAYAIPAAAAVAAAAGTIREHLRRAEYPASVRLSLIFLASGFATTVAGFALFAARYFQAQGRYLYPALVPISIVGVIGLAGLVPRRYQRAALCMGCAWMYCLSIVFLKTLASVA